MPRSFLSIPSTDLQKHFSLHHLHLHPSHPGFLINLMDPYLQLQNSSNNMLILRDASECLFLFLQMESIFFWSLAKSNKLPPRVQKPPIANNLKIAEVKFTKFHIFRSMSRKSGLLSRPAGEAGRARSGPCSGSWCW